MTFTPEQTQKLVVSSSLLVKLVGVGFTAWIMVVGFIGKSVIDKVDILTNAFNVYTLGMERRVTALEESQKDQNSQIQELKHNNVPQDRRLTR